MRPRLGVGRDGGGCGFRVALVEVVGGVVEDVAVFEGADVVDALLRARQTLSSEEVLEGEELEVLSDVESGGLVGGGV